MVFKVACKHSRITDGANGATNRARRAPRARVVIALVALTALVATIEATAALPPPSKFVRVAAGTIGNNSWKLGIAGQARRRCYRLSLAGGDVESSGITCTRDSRPGRDWRQLMGTGNDTASVELDLTRTRVRTMKLLTGPSPTRWIHVRPRRLSRDQARRAHVKRDFRFAVLHAARDKLCVKRVILFDRHHQKLSDDRVPCES
jgi:hypothetical protein